MKSKNQANFNLPIRPRRRRQTNAIRNLVAETRLHPNQLIWPLFVTSHRTSEIKTMPGVQRNSLKDLLIKIENALSVGIEGIALFPEIDEKLKSKNGKEAWNSKGLAATSIREIKQQFPEICIFADVALDPYSSDGHDGIVVEGKVHNDETLVALGRQALTLAEAGADFVAPSDMMDGRVAFIRRELDQKSFTDVGILAYTAKYASAFYGPFRDALNSAPKFGDKKTYQMDPRNSLEALEEAILDSSESADILMVKPALAYLDIINLLAKNCPQPIAAYNVSGEYAMIKFAAKHNSLNETLARDEMLTSIARAGARLILSYFAYDWAKDYKKSGR